MSPITTERAVFTGRVQGVGFRFTVRSIARRYPVKGYVRNMPDGAVELVMQGATLAMNDLLAEVSEHFRGNITHYERVSIETEEQFQHFEIRF